jgi:hypothetical protein
MRHAQKEYFRTRGDSALAKARSLEAKVDRCCSIVLSGQREMFGDFDTPPPATPTDSNPG